MRKPTQPSDRALSAEDIPLGTTVYLGRRKIKGRKPIQIEQPVSKQKEKKQDE